MTMHEVDVIPVRLREEGKDRGGSVRFTFLGEYPHEEAERVARAKAAEIGPAAQVNDYGGWITVYVPQPTATDRERIQRLSVAYTRTRHLEEETRSELRAAVLDLIEHGTSEVEAARLAGVTRMTIRSWQGKR